jgi:elongation factor 2
LREIKDHLKVSFEWASKEGALAGEQIRGMRVNLLDTHLIADNVHRGGAQMIPCGRRVYYASQLTAQPRMQEPVYLCEIQAPDSALGQIYQCMSQRRGEVIGEEHISGTPLIIVKSYLPVSESFGFTEYLRRQT